MADGFLGRWAKRKTDARQGLVPHEPLASSPLPAPAGGSEERVCAVLSPSPQRGEGGREGAVAPAVGPAQGARAAPLPTLQDALALSAESDFKPFMARGIDPQVKNAAMKKLFTDPHYNVMDRLDIYIDDYSQADPIPESMLRQMVSAQFLNLLDKQEQPEPSASGAGALTPPAQDDHTHLRLQPDDAAPAPGPGRGAE
ncbi:MAG: DUF3306 domain-containing protein [Betaproteobacteria bacterium]